MVKVIANNHIKPEALQIVAPLFREMIACTHKEDGCLEYALFIDEKDETHFTFVETWESQAALDAHMQSPHFLRIIPQIGQYKAKDGAVTLYKAFE